MEKKVGMISLGCPKNQVDAEVMLSDLKAAGFTVTADESEAQVIIVNTCGFIEDAKAEAIENILEAARFKQEGNLRALIVTGCLAERYRDEITKDIPEVDVVVGIGKNHEIVNIVNAAFDGSFTNCYGEKTDLRLGGDRVLTTPPYTAYLKVAEGCDNCCTYCAIPLIRGRFRSRKIEDCVAEARKLAASGVSELVVVAQDTTRYGEDIYGEPRLTELLAALCEIDGLHWIRTLYTYPERITDKLLKLIAEQPKLVPYLDMPIQHCNGEILHRMNRRGDRESLLALVKKIRAAVPDITLRTTLLVGFPSETEEQYNELCEFVKEARFDKLGCFAYSEEEGTPAAGFENQIDMQVRKDRSEHIMDEQLPIVIENSQKRLGIVCEVLVEGYDNDIKCYYGRSATDAPDIDGKVFFLSDKKLSVGEYHRVLITDTLDYDLLGELEGME